MKPARLGHVVVSDVVCINRKRRADRKKQMKRHAKQKGLPLRFVRAAEDAERPRVGKFASHLERWRKAYKDPKCRALLVLEDDARVLATRLALPVPPDDWDVLLLGGNVQRVLQDERTDGSAHWKRCCATLTHAYVVHRRALGRLIAWGLEYLKGTPRDEVDLSAWLCGSVHPRVRCYAATPQRVIQADGWSDVQNRMVTYREQLTGTAAVEGDASTRAPRELPKPRMRTVDATDASAHRVAVALEPAVPDDQMPRVALVTCVHNQRDLFLATQWAYYRFDYPRDRMQWIVVDDSRPEERVNVCINGDDKSIKYVKCEMSANSFLSVAKKLNLAGKYVTPDTRYMVHVAPDCYYPPDSVRNRVRLLESYGGAACVGCTTYGVYDLVTKRSRLEHQPDAHGNKTILFGPSLAYAREWWAARPFDEEEYTLEAFYFVRGRWAECLDVPFSLVLTALTWPGHAVGDASRYGVNEIGNSTASGSAADAGTATTRGTDGRRLTDRREANVEEETPEGFDLAETWDMQTQNTLSMVGALMAAPGQ